MKVKDFTGAASTRRAFIQKKSSSSKKSKIMSGETEEIQSRLVRISQEDPFADDDTDEAVEDFDEVNDDIEEADDDIDEADDVDEVDEDTDDVDDDDDDEVEDEGNDSISKSTKAGAHDHKSKSTRAKNGEGEGEFSGWADSMSRILNSNKPRNKKTLILSRAKKDYEINKSSNNKVKRDDLEVEGDDSTEVSRLKEESVDNSSETTISLKTQRKLELKQKKFEKEWENLSRSKPVAGNLELERDLVKIATKGVVQLFNAVGLQQKTLKAKLRTAKTSEFKKDKILNQTEEIFDMAMKKSRKMASNSDSENDLEIKEEVNDDTDSLRRSGNLNGVKNKHNLIHKTDGCAKKPAWQALQDDFMLGAEMKDWDKSSDSE